MALDEDALEAVACFTHTAVVCLHLAEVFIQQGNFDAASDTLAKAYRMLGGVAAGNAGKSLSEIEAVQERANWWRAHKLRPTVAGISFCFIFGSGGNVSRCPSPLLYPRSPARSGLVSKKPE